MFKKNIFYYQARFNKGDDCLLTGATVSKAAGYISAYALLLPGEHSSLILGYSLTIIRDYKTLSQLLEASVADEILVV